MQVESVKWWKVLLTEWNKNLILGGGFEADEVLSGEIAQLNIYDYAMPDDMVLEMKMFCDEKGNLVNDDTLTTVGTLEAVTEEKECKSCPSPDG